MTRIESSDDSDPCSPLQRCAVELKRCCAGAPRHCCSAARQLHCPDALQSVAPMHFGTIAPTHYCTHAFALPPPHPSPCPPAFALPACRAPLRRRRRRRRLDADNHGGAGGVRALGCGGLSETSRATGPEPRRGRSRASRPCAHRDRTAPRSNASRAPFDAQSRRPGSQEQRGSPPLTQTALVD